MKFSFSPPGGELTQEDADKIEVSVGDSIAAPPAAWTRMTGPLTIRAGSVQVRANVSDAMQIPSATVMRFYRVVRWP
jgi:hypothetical protein